MSDFVYAVAVDTQPVLWVVYCEICDEELGAPTESDDLLELLETEHVKAHGLNN
jgi:hypothetical protein